MNHPCKFAAYMLVATLIPNSVQAQTAPATGSQVQATAAPGATRPSGPLQQKLAPGLANYTDQLLFGEIWPGAGLSPRDRSLAVISALIAMNRPAQLQGHLTRALNNGVTPLEASGALTHLAFYAGWPSAVTALEVFDRVYTAQNVDLAALQAAAPALPRTQAQPAATQILPPQLGAVAPKFAELTNRALLDDLWRRSDLSVRDRSLVTITALMAMGDADLMDPYLRRGIAAGLTRDQIAEALTHLAFYAGWGKATEGLTAMARALPPTGPAPIRQQGQIIRKGALPATTGSAENFTGTVHVTAPYRVSGESRLRGASVRFAPKARSAWHRHPLGQTLIVTEGCGWTQAEGGPIEKICAGDVAWIGPGVKHWHGATDTTAMTHVTASESIEGQSVEWLEQVSDEAYAKGRR